MCKRKCDYCKQMCAAFECEKLQHVCEHGCEVRFFAVRRIMDEYCEQGTCDRRDASMQIPDERFRQVPMVQAGSFAPKAQDSRQLLKHRCFGRRHYCSELCAAFPSWDRVLGMRCRDRCESRFGAIEMSWGDYCRDGLCKLAE
mmetsp:Transcript_1712/g.4837  ORF Transcript_1712/g.4837 Transcript_1712/m.4837 type:complete len:143 (+) Transcript_1712:2-430(+)